MLIVVIIIILLYAICTNNKILRLKNKVKQSKSTIDVYLNKRFDLIPNLVECVKAYMDYEKEILQSIIKERNEYNQSNNKELKKAGEINEKCNYIIATAEKYPELKANEQFLHLQKVLVKTENEIQAARRLYNGDVTLYNTTIKKFPICIISFIFFYKEEPLFNIEEYKKENINIDL